MTQKQQIVEFMKGKESVKLADLYCLAGLSHAAIRGILNSEINKGRTFERIRKSTYKLKE